MEFRRLYHWWPCSVCCVGWKSVSYTWSRDHRNSWPLLFLRLPPSCSEIRGVGMACLLCDLHDHVWGGCCPSRQSYTINPYWIYSLPGTVLTLLAIVYGSSASWCSICSDYYVQYPVNTSKTKVFLLTTMGITIPSCIGMCMGACVGM